jgi:hypothetical protein
MTLSRRGFLVGLISSFAARSLPPAAILDSVAVREITEYIVEEQSLTRLDTLFGYMYVRPSGHNWHPTYPDPRSGCRAASGLATRLP